MGNQIAGRSHPFWEASAEAVNEPATEGFFCAPVYSQRDVAALVADSGLRALREHVLPSSLYSGGHHVACLKYFCGFISLRQGPDEPCRHLSEISEWNRVILAIHDFRHEYLVPSPGSDDLISSAQSRLRCSLNNWISCMPRLKHRLTVGANPKMGLVTIESHQINGRPDIEALEQFIVQYLAQDHLTRDLTAAFAGEEPNVYVPPKELPSWFHRHFIEPVFSRWSVAYRTSTATSHR